MVFQMVLGLIGTGYVFGGSAHISGAVHEHSQSIITHISGSVYSGENSTIVKTHVSGSRMVSPVEEPETVQSKTIKKAIDIGITLGAPEKSTSSQVKKKAIEKTKTTTTIVKNIEQARLRGRIKKRKACWKTCGNIWEVRVQEQCSTLSDSQMQHCEKELFKERLTCARQNCREITQ